MKIRIEKIMLPSENTPMYFVDYSYSKDNWKNHSCHYDYDKALEDKKLLLQGGDNDT